MKSKPFWLLAGSVVAVLVIGTIVLTNVFRAPSDKLPDVASLPDATDTQVVDLKDGDTYEMTAGFVQIETLLHSHGLRLDNASDGTDLV